MRRFVSTRLPFNLAEGPRLASCILVGLTSYSDPGMGASNVNYGYFIFFLMLPGDTLDIL